MSGPPFSLGNITTAIDELVRPDHYSIELLGRHEILDLEPRFNARGD